MRRTLPGLPKASSSRAGKAGLRRYTECPLHTCLEKHRNRWKQLRSLRESGLSAFAELSSKFGLCQVVMVGWVMRAKHVCSQPPKELIDSLSDMDKESGLWSSCVELIREQTLQDNPASLPEIRDLYMRCSETMRARVSAMPDDHKLLHELNGMQSKTQRKKHLLQHPPPAYFWEELRREPLLGLFAAIEAGNVTTLLRLLLQVQLTDRSISLCADAKQSNRDWFIGLKVISVDAFPERDTLFQVFQYPRAVFKDLKDNAKFAQLTVSVNGEVFTNIVVTLEVAYCVCRATKAEKVFTTAMREMPLLSRE